LADWWSASTSRSYCQIEHQRLWFLQWKYQLMQDVFIAYRLIKTQLIGDFQCFSLWYQPASFLESSEYSNARTAGKIYTLQQIPKRLGLHCSSELLEKYVSHRECCLKLIFQKQVPRYLQELHLTVWRKSARVGFAMLLLSEDNWNMERSTQNADNILKGDGVP
jgi:hypothetical protein